MTGQVHYLLENTEPRNFADQRREKGCCRVQWRMTGTLPRSGFSTAKSTLKTISGVVWLSGAMALLLQGACQSAQALALSSARVSPWRQPPV